MADINTTLHPEGAPEDDLYPVTRLELIIDKNGNSRFVEGSVNLRSVSGLTKKYGKWSLSGTHLQIVLALEIEENTSFSSLTSIAELSLPDWIGSKIIPVNMAGSVAGYVESKNFTLTITGYGLTGNEIKCFFYKATQTVFEIYCWGVPQNADKQFARIEFNFLIDDE